MWLNGGNWSTIKILHAPISYPLLINALIASIIGDQKINWDTDLYVGAYYLY